MEEWLDRVLASSVWCRDFSKAKVWSLECSCSSHLPIFMDLIPQILMHWSKRFRFENPWLREVDCLEVVHNSWDSSASSPIQSKISVCRVNLLKWGGHLA